MKTIYVIPNECPFESVMLTGRAYGSTVKEEIFWDLSNRNFLPKNLEIKYNRGTYLSWTCAGCTVGLGNEDQPCQQRQCGIGGKPLAGL